MRHFGPVQSDNFVACGLYRVFHYFLYAKRKVSKNVENDPPHNMCFLALTSFQSCLRLNIKCLIELEPRNSDFLSTRKLTII